MSAMSASMISSIVWMMNLIAKSKKGLLKFGSFKYSPYLCSRKESPLGCKVLGSVAEKQLRNLIPLG